MPSHIFSTMPHHSIRALMPFQLSSSDFESWTQTAKAMAASCHCISAVVFSWYVIHSLLLTRCLRVLQPICRLQPTALTAITAYPAFPNTYSPPSLCPISLLLRTLASVSPCFSLDLRLNGDHPLQCSSDFIMLFHSVADSWAIDFRTFCSLVSRNFGKLWKYLSR